MLIPALLALAVQVPDHAIVLASGRQVRVASQPIRDGRLVVSRLDDGTLVSLPLERVDWEATVRRNAGLAGAGDGPAGKARPGRAAIRVSNRTIAEFAARDPGRAAVPSTGRAARLSEVAPHAEPAAAVQPAPPADDRGRGPEFWRERAAWLRERTRLAERELEAAREALRDEQATLVHGREVASRDGSIRVVHFVQSREERAVISLRLSELEAEVRDRQARLAEASQREADLREEARLAGADPGWLRLPHAFGAASAAR